MTRGKTAPRGLGRPLHASLLLAVAAAPMALALAWWTVPRSSQAEAATPPSGAGGSGSAEGFRLGPPQKLADLDARVRESSGLAASRTRPGWLWTHGDGGGGPFLTRFDPVQGESETFRVAFVHNRDWEDLASFKRAGRSWLLVADTGDNHRTRPHVTLHLVPEPNSDPPRGKSLPVAASLRFTYADGPRDCEAVAVEPGGAAVWLASKEIDATGRVHGKAGVYRLPLRWSEQDKTEPLADDTDTPRVVERLATLDTVMPTGMDLHPDGQTMLLVTYMEGLAFTRVADQPWDAALAAAPTRLALPPRRQGEAVCFSADGDAVFLTSEKPGEPVWRLSVE